MSEILSSQEDNPGKKMETSYSSLESLGITPETVRGKTILDIHGGKKTFGEEKASLGALLVEDLDSNTDEFYASDRFSFDSEYFDLIIATDGILQGNPWDAKVMETFKEAVRVIKDTGEIRIANPFQGYERQESDPKDWKPNEELEFLLYNEGIDIKTKMITSEEDPKIKTSYLIITKGAAGK